MISGSRKVPSGMGAASPGSPTEIVTSTSQPSVWDGRSPVAHPPEISAASSPSRISGAERRNRSRRRTRRGSSPVARRASSASRPSHGPRVQQSSSSTSVSGSSSRSFRGQMSRSSTGCSGSSSSIHRSGRPCVRQTYGRASYARHAPSGPRKAQAPAGCGDSFASSSGYSRRMRSASISNTVMSSTQQAEQPRSHRSRAAWRSASGRVSRSTSRCSRRRESNSSSAVIGPHRSSTVRSGLVASSIMDHRGVAQR